MPLSPVYLILLLFIGIFLIALIQVGIITIAFDKLGLSPRTGLVLLFGSVFGSWFNIPVWARPHGERIDKPEAEVKPLIWGLPKPRHTGKTLIAINVGGCVIPVLVSFYLLTQHTIGITTTVIALSAVSALSYWIARPIPGIGIGMPLLLAPLASALVALLLNPEHSAPLAYIAGTLGVLIGADLLHLRDIDRMGMPIASIGGAGTFDGIFLTGIVAALLA